MRTRSGRCWTGSRNEPDERARDPHPPRTRGRALEEPGELVGLEHGERDLPLDQRRVSVVGEPPVEQGTRPHLVSLLGALDDFERELQESVA